MAVYGSGVVYGTGEIYGDNQYFISPDHGSIVGGTRVEIAGTNFLYTDCDDAFDDSTIDPALWTALASGGGSSVEEAGGRLRLAVGPNAASFAQLQSTHQVDGTDVEVEYNVVTPLASPPALGDVELATLRLYVSATTYARISRKTGPPFGDRYEAVIVVAGVTIESAQMLTTATSGVLRIIRDGTTVYLLAGTTEVLRHTGFVSTSANVQIRADNLAAAYAFRTDFDNFRVRTMVMFGTEPMLDAQVLSNDRIVGTTPEGVAVGDVDIHFAICLTDLPIFTDAYTYEDPAAFRILADTSLQQTTDVSVTNDPILKNLRPGRPGFGR